MTYTDELVDARIRAAAPRSGDANWADVRRRARRKRIPAVVAAGLVVATLIAAPAVAFRNELDDLWAQVEPDKNLYVRAIAACGEGTFTFEMDPRRGAVVRQRGETLARATVTTREIECDVPVRSFKSIPDEFRFSDVDRRSSAATELTCRTDAPLDIVLNPIWYEDVETGESRTNGTTLLVAERGTRRTLASAVLRLDPYSGRNWSAAHWDSAVCAPR